MPDNEEKRALSIEEIAALLGAEPPEEIGPVQLDPIGMRVLATRIGKRLASKGGRPTDASWEINRKVPMKKATWDQLKKVSDAFGEEDVRVAPGQLAAIALERGLPTLTQGKREDTVTAAGEIGFTRYKFREQSEEEARELCSVINDRGVWQCM